MERFRIVDTHVHLWHPEQLRYPWLSEVPSLNRPYLLKDYTAASGELEIESIVFVQCDTHPDDSLKETAWGYFTGNDSRATDSRDCCVGTA